MQHQYRMMQQHQQQLRLQQQQRAAVAARQNQAITSSTPQYAGNYQTSVIKAYPQQVIFVVGM